MRIVINAAGGSMYLRCDVDGCTYQEWVGSSGDVESLEARRVAHVSFAHPKMMPPPPPPNPMEQTHTPQPSLFHIPGQASTGD